MFQLCMPFISQKDNANHPMGYFLSYLMMDVRSNLVSSKPIVNQS